MHCHQVHGQLAAQAHMTSHDLEQLRHQFKLDRWHRLRARQARL